MKEELIKDRARGIALLQVGKEIEQFDEVDKMVYDCSFNSAIEMANYLTSCNEQRETEKKIIAINAEIEQVKQRASERKQEIEKEYIETINKMKNDYIVNLKLVNDEISSAYNNVQALNVFKYEELSEEQRNRRQVAIMRLKEVQLKKNNLVESFKREKEIKYDIKKLHIMQIENYAKKAILELKQKKARVMNGDEQ